jgi:hypothetical protein
LVAPHNGTKEKGRLTEARRPFPTGCPRTQRATLCHPTRHPVKLASNELERARRRRERDFTPELAHLKGGSELRLNDGVDV